MNVPKYDFFINLCQHCNWILNESNTTKINRHYQNNAQ